MRTAYRMLAVLLCLGVAFQAAVMVYAIFGTGIWIDAGGTLDKATQESATNEPPFPEFIGVLLHIWNGVVVIPILALALLVVSFFAGVPRGRARAGMVVGLVVLQITLGVLGHGLSILGALHGLNALVLFSTAFLAAQAAARPAQVAAPTENARSTAPAGQRP